MSTTAPTEYLTISEACAEVQRLTRQKARPSSNTFWRWMRRGIKSRGGERVHLRHVRIGGKLFTSSQWIGEFLEELTAADREHFAAQPEREYNPPAPSRTSTREHEQARARLQAAGVLS